MENILEQFHPVVRSWFTVSFTEPSPPQMLGWKSIADGNNTLIVAPTGSGKTLAAFLWCINHLVEENILFGHSDVERSEEEESMKFKKKDSSLRKKHAPQNDNLVKGVRVLYVSPLKALNNDIHRNLEIPLSGILREAKNQNIEIAPIRSAVRTGDTTQSERNAMLKNPPDILITTPESLYLMLSSEKARKMFHSVRYVIVDEIHSLSNNKRGVHLSLTLERLEKLVRESRNPMSHPERSRRMTTEESTFIRIGLSATQKPLETVAQFLGGYEWKNKKLHPRPVSIIDAGYKKNVDLKVICAVNDFTDMPLDSVWHAIYPQLLELIFAHRSTLIFVNNRRLAERLSAKLNEMLSGESDTFNNYAVPVKTISSLSRMLLSGIQKNNSDFHNNNTEAIKVFAYHGSMSRTVREQLETDLKSGKLRALITTSALELGIDIGSVDLVIQIQSPKGIARGLQRVGRSGHLVKAESKGRLFVTHRDDLLETSVVAKEMLNNEIERTSVPQNCLDVLAQQIVAMVSVEEWNVDDLFDCVRQSFCYHTLSENIFHSVLQMVSGRYSSETFRELRARIVWDKLHNTLSPLPGSSKLAIMNGGTIPNRGYYGVYLEDLKTKVGEVDEEFIYESRAGDTFILGSTVWRMIDIDANKVVVQPAPGQPARMPFWRGEAIGRTYELSVKIGKFIEQISAQTVLSTARRGIGWGEDIAKQSEVEESIQLTQNDIQNSFPIDHFSLYNLLNYIEEQKTATQILPTHQSLVVEGFRDEIGDPRIVVHSIFGKGVNGLLGIVLQHQLQQRLGIEIQMLYNDNGILFRCSDVERLPLDLFSDINLHSAQQIILENIPSSPLFGALFRQNAERALLLPKGNYGKRTPFFLQRLRSADLLQIVRQYNDFPIVIETIRECLNDALDFEHFKEIISKIESEEIHIHTVQNETPSPFAMSVLFDFAAVYMYEWDQPKNIVQQQFASLNRELLSEIVQIDSVKNVVRAEAIEKVEEQLQFTAATRKARSPEELMDVFLRLGELTEQEIFERSENKIFFRQLLEKKVIVPIKIGDKKYFVLNEELNLYTSLGIVILRSDAKGITTKNLKKEFSFSKAESLCYLILRYLRTHGPLTLSQIAQRFSVTENECKEILSSLKPDDNIVCGQFINEITEEQWCYRPNLDRIHRASISLRRKEIKPATLADFAQFLLCWQNRHPRYQEKSDGIFSVIEKMEGLTLPNEIWENEIFRTRIQQYDASVLRSLVSRGELFCVGNESGKSQWITRGNGNYFLSEQNIDSLSAASQKIFYFLKESGASFLSDMREELHLTLSALNKALAELFWRGLITNDVVDELVNIKRYRSDATHFESASHLPDERFEIVNPKRNPLSKIAMRGVRKALKEVAGWNGRWSLVHTKHLLGAKVSDEEKIHHQAEQLLLRYGIVAREIAKREENVLPYSVLAMELQRMEMRGEIRRGYFVEGLSGMQFALPDAVRLLNETKSTSHAITLSDGMTNIIVLNACDPANPFGTGIEIANTEFLRISRVASNFIILHSGAPILWIENFGMRMFILNDLIFGDNIKQGIAQFIAHMRQYYTSKEEIIVEYINNQRPTESNYYDLLRSLGFYRDKVQTLRLDLR